MRREREPEVMASRQEAQEYADLASRRIDWVLDAFVRQVTQACPRWASCLDLGTGTGHVPARLAKAARPGQAGNGSRTIVGVDLSPEMLRVASSWPAPAGVRLEWVEGDISRLPFADNSFDLVLSHLVLHHLDDPVAFLNEVNRVARHGAAIFIRDVVRPNSPFHAWLTEHLFTPGYTRAQRRMYADSIRSAFTVREIASALRQSELRGCHVARCFSTHVDVVRTQDGVSRYQSLAEAPIIERFTVDWARRRTGQRAASF
mgnify:CR=1 FL=1